MASEFLPATLQLLTLLVLLTPPLVPGLLPTLLPWLAPPLVVTTAVPSHPHNVPAGVSSHRRVDFAASASMPLLPHPRSPTAGAAIDRVPPPPVPRAAAAGVVCAIFDRK